MLVLHHCLLPHSQISFPKNEKKKVFYQKVEHLHTSKVTFFPTLFFPSLCQEKDFKGDKVMIRVFYADLFSYKQ